MKSEELELDVLKRQNRQMAIKLQFYRVQNQEIKAKNQELNQWVGNLSEVFSTVSASWESITILEETLLTLMKKKTDVKDKTLLRKYQFHFKTFADIINNLSEKIKNAGHSDQATKDAKEQLRSFVKNYELIFKQFIETYFKFNQEYSQFLADLKKHEDVKEQVRSVINRNGQYTQRIKEFESYVESLKQKFQMFQEFNNQKLLQGVVKRKQQEIQSLKERNNILQRRIKIIFDYNSASVQMQLEGNQCDYECVCGGVQLQYMKKIWEEKLKHDGENLSGKQTQDHINGTKSQSVQKLQTKLAAVEEQKQNLITRNSLLLQKISKMSAQFKLTDQMILRSSTYIILKDQCHHLMDYVTQLLSKLKKQQEFIILIEKARQEEIKEVKKKYQRGRHDEKNNNVSLFNNFSSPVELFKTQIVTITKDLLNAYYQLNKKHVKSQQYLKQFKSLFQPIRKTNQQLNKKVNELQTRQLSKTDGLEFKYEKYKDIQTNVESLLQKNMPELLQLWKQFLNHVKSRDKKNKDLESIIRKKDKEIASKIKIQELTRATLNETQKVFLENKDKLDNTETFIKKVQAQLTRLAQQNYQTQYQSQQDNNLLSIRLKAETQARNKLQQKLSVMGKIETQITQIRQNENNIQKQYDTWITSHKKELQQCNKDILEKEIIIKNLNEQLNQKNKQLQKLQGQKETLNSSVRQLKTQVENMKTMNQNQVVKMQLDEYKRKIMCSCTGDRQRQVVLKTCPHLFCKRCIDETASYRNRKCPLCGIRFSKSDIHEIKWN